MPRDISLFAESLSSAEVLSGDRFRETNTAYYKLHPAIVRVVKVCCGVGHLSRSYSCQVNEICCFPPVTLPFLVHAGGLPCRSGAGLEQRHSG